MSIPTGRMPIPTGWKPIPSARKRRTSRYFSRHRTTLPAHIIEGCRRVLVTLPNATVCRGTALRGTLQALHQLWLRILIFAGILIFVGILPTLARVGGFLDGTAAVTGTITPILWTTILARIHDLSRCTFAEEKSNHERGNQYFFEPYYTTRHKCIPHEFHTDKGSP